MIWSSSADTAAVVLAEPIRWDPRPSYVLIASAGNWSAMDWRVCTAASRVAERSMTAGARGEVTPRGRAMGWWIERPAQGFSTFSDDGRMERCLDEPLSWFPARIPQPAKREESRPLSPVH